MPKQTTEMKFRKSLQRLTMPIWYHKLQANAFAHTKTPFDFLVITNNYNYAFEIKEHKVNTIINARYKFIPEAQEQALLNFQSVSGKNKSFVVIRFKTPKNIQDITFFIPIEVYILRKKTRLAQSLRGCKSFMIKDLEEISLYTEKGRGLFNLNNVII